MTPEIRGIERGRCVKCDRTTFYTSRSEPKLCPSCVDLWRRTSVRFSHSLQEYAQMYQVMRLLNKTHPSWGNAERVLRVVELLKGFHT